MSSDETAPTKSRLRVWGRRVAPYVIAAVALGVILYEYPPARIAAEMKRGDLLAAAPFAALLIALGIFVVSWSDKLIIDGFITSPPYLHLVRARAALSLLGMLGYGAGIGGHGVWLARVTGCGARRAGGLMLYVMSCDLVAVSTVASASIWIGGAEVGGPLPIAAPVVAAVLLTLKLIGPFHLFGPPQRVPTVLRPWGAISRKRALAAIALRTVNIYWISMCVWLGANAFGMRVPLAVMTVYKPIVLVVGSMPVNVGGFGAVQGVWLLLEPWADSGEQVLAFSVVWQLLVGAAIVIRGVPFIRKVVAEIDAGAASWNEAEQTSEPTAE